MSFSRLSPRPVLHCLGDLGFSPSPCCAPMGGTLVEGGGVSETESNAARQARSIRTSSAPGTARAFRAAVRHRQESAAAASVDSLNTAARSTTSSMKRSSSALAEPLVRMAVALQLAH